MFNIYEKINGRWIKVNAQPVNALRARLIESNLDGLTRIISDDRSTIAPIAVSY